MSRDQRADRPNLKEFLITVAWVPKSKKGKGRRKKTYCLASSPAGAFEWLMKRLDRYPDKKKRIKILQIKEVKKVQIAGHRA